MTDWFATAIVGPGRLPLFFMMLAFATAFAFIRISTRMIRADVSWWPGNVTPGGLHIHHVVFGLVMMLVSGFGFIALANYHTPAANCVLAAVFGVGAALVLDEFALVLHLRDVYWTEEGRTSIDAVFVAFAITVLFVLGVHPLGFSGADVDTDDAATTISSIVLLVVQYGLATIVLLKGKIWTGLFGLFFPPLLVVGAVRLGRPPLPLGTVAIRFSAREDAQRESSRGHTARSCQSRENTSPGSSGRSIRRRFDIMISDVGIPDRGGAEHSRCSFGHGTKRVDW